MRPPVRTAMTRWITSILGALLMTGAALAQDLSGLVGILNATPDGSWVRVNLNHYSDVWTPAELRPLNGSTNPDPDKIIIAWSSFAWDTKRGDLILYGGGHANYPGNDVYRWRGSTRMWERASLPSEIVLTPNGFHTAIDGVDRAPVSSHTYDNTLYLPVIDRVLTFGGAAYNTGNPYQRPLSASTSSPTGPYLFDPAKADGNKVGGSTGSHVKRVAPHPEVVGGNMWTNRDVFQAPITGTPPVSHINGMTAYATENGKDVVYTAARPGQGTDLTLYRYTINDINNIALDKFEVVGQYWSGPTDQGAGAYDPVRKLFIRTGTQSQPVAYWDLSPTRVDMKDNVATPVDMSGGFDFSRMRYSGMDFDPTVGVFALWYGGKDVWMLVPPSPLSTAGWKLQRISQPLGETPTMGIDTGVIGKFKYIPNLDAYMALQDAVAGNIWLYRPYGWQPPAGSTTNAAPSIAITAPANGASIAAGTAIAVNSTPVDSDGTIARVDFYVDGTLVATDTAAPYTTQVSGLSAGPHTLHAVALDNSGASGTSSPVTVNITVGTTSTVTLQDGLNAYAGTRDAYLSAYSYSENNGSATTMLENSNYVDLVRFAVFAREGGPVPDGATIVSAQVSLYKTTDYDFTYELHRLLVDWVEGQVNYAGPKSGAAWAVPGASGIGTDYGAAVDSYATAAYAPGWLTFDVKDALQTLSNGQPNFGWRMVRVTGNGNDRRFATREYATQLQRPKLVVTYASTGGGGGNTPPTVSITSPVAGAVFAQGAAVPVTASAADADGSVAKVDFYVDGAFAASATSTPYTASLGGPAAGNHTLTAIATDNLGATTTSAAVSITVSANAPPTVSITSPASGASFASGTPVAVTATATDAGGSVTKVDFYVDGTFAASVTSAPYTTTLSTLAVGGHTLTAVVTDNLGATATSAGVTITVTGGGGGGVSVTLQDGLNGYAATRDTYLSSWNPANVNGALATMLESGAYVDLVRFAIFARDGGPVPDGATITSAQLSLYKTTDYDFTYEARRMLVDWVEAEATWQQSRGRTPWGVPGANGAGMDYAATADATATAAYAPGWLTFNVTGGVQAMADGVAPNYGWRLLRVSGNGNEKRFATRENATQAQRPKLVVTYAGAGGGGNTPPTVSITSPTSGASFAQGASVPVTASAADTDGSVARVDFFVDGAFAASATSAPYTATLAGLAPGNRSLTATATDNLGAATTSAAVSITVIANTPPTVAITSPVSGTSFPSASAIAVTATAADPGGSVAKVDFYVDGAFAATATSAPYTASLTGLVAGGHTLTAVATDNLGMTTTSSGVTITVTVTVLSVTLQDGLNGYTATRDTYLSSWNPGNVNGAVATILESGAYTDLVRFAVFARDGGPIPNGATITSAQLSLYKTTDYDFIYEARRMLVDWVEAEASWQQSRGRTAWAVAGANGVGLDFAATADATASVGFAPGWLTFDVAGSLQKMSEGAQPNFGWRLLRVSGNGNEKRFASRESATQSQRPKLVVTYTP